MNCELLDNTQQLAPIIDEEAESFHSSGEEAQDAENTYNDTTDDTTDDCDQDIDPILEEEIEKEDEKQNHVDIPDSAKECSFGVDGNDDIPEDDIRQMLFLFCVNEDIPLHYKQLLGKIIKKQTYKKNEKLFIFNMIGYVWQKAKQAQSASYSPNGEKQNEELTKIQKVIIVRRIHKFIFGKFDV
jgi:hypothetical protein